MKNTLRIWRESNHLYLLAKSTTTVKNRETTDV